MDISSVMYSPELVSRLLHRFLSGAQRSNPKGIKFELIYWLLPLLINDKIRIGIENSNVNSTFDNYILNDDNMPTILEINELISNFREITNKGLIYLGSKVSLKIDDFIHLNEVVDHKSENVHLKEYYRAAYYLGTMMSKENYKSLFLKLEVTDI
ncbi:three component ABC system middle component [Vibrio cholerae]|uniref:three component ABC system middle component n=1 Tax=Vibrio cholerae TaxID=666 RepID=UPI001C907B93|nr:three component ABC system middle component [Vibrio cholerae]MBY3691507.1 hypothetical protein [Vibrio cholerae]